MGEGEVINEFHFLVPAFRSSYKRTHTMHTHHALLLLLLLLLVLPFLVACRCAWAIWAEEEEEEGEAPSSFCMSRECQSFEAPFGPAAWLDRCFDCRRRCRGRHKEGSFSVVVGDGGGRWQERGKQQCMIV